MPIKVQCRCGRSLLVPDARAGRAVQCPKCRERVDVPGERVPLPEKPAASFSPPAPQSMIDNAAADAIWEALASERVATTVSEEPRSAPEPSPPAQELAAPEPPPPPPPAPPPPPVQTIAPEPVPPLPPEISRAVPPSPPAADKTPAAAPPKEPPLPVPLPRPTPAPPPPPTKAEIPPAAAMPPPAPPPAPVPVPVPTPAAPVISTRPGYQPDAEKLTAAYVLAMLLVVLGVFSLVPGVYDVVRYLRDTDSDFVGRYAFVVFFLGMLHFAYAFYLGQLPDWSTAWVLTAATLVQAAIYASVLTALHLAGGQSQFVQMLDLGQHVDNGHARAWCFIMLCVTGMAAYFCGRVSMRWRRAFVLVREANRRG